MHHGAGRLARCEAKTGKGVITQALALTSRCGSSLGSSTDHAGPSTALVLATDFDCFTPAGSNDLYTARAANQQPAWGRLPGVGAQEARWRRRLLHCTGRQPAAVSGLLLGVGAQEARWRGRPLHCMGWWARTGSGLPAHIPHSVLQACTLS